jgi:putative DNA primase/helicase
LDVDWPKPKELPTGLPSVDPFDLDFMPDALRPWIEDIANRLQCPPDYVAVTAMVALGSVIGRRVGIKPQLKTDWVEVPNIWGGFIGRPGMLKSPAMQEALKPLHRLEAEAEKENEIAREAYDAGMSAYKVRQQVKVALEKDALKKAKSTKINIDFDLGEEPREPIPVRYRTNDSSYEALGELLRDNPAGILIERDELVSLLKHLDREEQAVARGFYLSGWSGTQPYSFDRIGRGHIALEAVCLSVLGGTQPARIGEYVRRANFGGAGGDGLIQRFGLLVWPDVSAEWRDIDESPKSEARERAWQIFERAAKLDPVTACELGALQGPFDKIPCFRLNEAAHDDFLGWRADLERRLRGGELSPAFEGHLAKYRKLVPALALINHITDCQEGDVTQKSLVRALSFAAYLESHARRIYRSSLEAEVSAAKAILKHIKAGDLVGDFTARDILRHDRAHLTDREQAAAGLSLLVELDHLAVIEPVTGPHGGRPKTLYSINPRS